MAPSTPIAMVLRAAVGPPSMVRSARKPSSRPAPSLRAAQATPALPPAPLVHPAISTLINHPAAQPFGAAERRPLVSPPFPAEESPPSPSPTAVRDTPAAPVARSPAAARAIVLELRLLAPILRLQLRTRLAQQA